MINGDEAGILNGVSDAIYESACEAIFVSNTGRAFNGGPVDSLPNALSGGVKVATVCQTHMARKQVESFEGLVEIAAKSFGALAAFGGK